jgi:hypothetical protein
MSKELNKWRCSARIARTKEDRRQAAILMLWEAHGVIEDLVARQSVACIMTRLARGRESTRAPSDFHNSPSC